MAKLSMNCKKMMVSEISNRLNNADILIITSYKGLTTQELNKLRKELRGISGEYLVVKDIMAKKALAEGHNSRVADLIKGEVGIALDRKEDPAYISKILMKFSKDHELMKIRGGIMNGEMISEQDIASLAALPGREALLGKLANVLNAPIQGLAGALNAIICKFVYAINAIKEKKEQQPEVKPQAEIKKEADQADQVQEEKEPEEDKAQPETEAKKEEQNG